MTQSTDIQVLEARIERLKSDLADAEAALHELREAWQRGVRDGFATGIRGLCPDTLDPYSYWSGWKEGHAARHGEEVTVDVAQICGL